MNKDLENLKNLLDNLLDNVTTVRSLIDNEKYDEINNYIVQRTKILKEIDEFKDKPELQIPKDFAKISDKIQQIEKENIHLLESKKAIVTQELSKINRKKPLLNAYTRAQDLESSGSMLDLSDNEENS